MGVDSTSNSQPSVQSVTTPLLGEADQDQQFRGRDAAEEEVQVHRNAQASTLPEGPAPPVAKESQPSQAGYHEECQDCSSTPQVHHVVIIQSNSFPPTVVCPYCRRQGPTIQYKTSGFCTWFTASLCCFIGCCMLFPFVFCCDSLKDTVHYCSHCRRYLGRTKA